MRNPFRYFNTSPEVIRLSAMMDVRYPLTLRQIEDLPFDRGIHICLETVRFWRNRFGPIFAREIRKRRLHDCSISRRRWHLDEIFVWIHGETHTQWRAVDHDGEVLELFATKRQDREAALTFPKRAMKR
jgi:putative transposase